LTKDWDQRRAMLLGMKDQKIHEAHRFLIERTRHLDLRKPSCEVSQFESENGDQCTLKIDVTHFAGVASVRQVFEALQFYFFNVEISFTEMTGMLAVRENEESAEKSVLHHRLCFTHPSGVLIEKNGICFIDSSGLESGDPDDHSAIIAGDFVDQDDLYPYCPLERVRKDTTSALKLSAFRRLKANRMAASSPTAGQEEETELVVVLTRWYFACIRNPEISVDKNMLQTISNEQPAGFDVMLKSMRQGMLLS
jgi:WASH complex subunit 7